eukprot:4826816-Prymnesium_polylepis.2
MIRDDELVIERGVALWAAVVGLEPVFDRAPLICVAVRGNHRVHHQLEGDGADEFIWRLVTALALPGKLCSHSLRDQLAQSGLVAKLVEHTTSRQAVF